MARRLTDSMWRTLLFALGCGLVTHVASAYTIKSELSVGCHETITTSALRTVRAQRPAAAPLAASEDEKALIGDLQFIPDPDMQDLGGATLLAAVRDNDLKGRSSDDLSQLAAVHGNPDGQQEHCLRSASEDEPGGTAAAIADCRAFIHGRIAEALAGLDQTGAVDPTNRTTLTVYLSVRGQVDALLPTYYVKMGQAIHAIEDSFTHTYRTPDGTKITVTLNWIDSVRGTLLESRDGPAHAKQLDRCDDPDSLRTTRRQLATSAVLAVLSATLDSSMTADQKMTAVDSVLDTYLGYSPGCTFDNGWCNAPEAALSDAKAGCGCGVAGVGGLGATFGAGLVVLLFFVRRSKRAVASVTTIAAALLVGTGSARAQSTTTTTTIPSATPTSSPTTETVTTNPQTTTTVVTTPTKPDTHAPPPPKLIPVAEPGPRDPTKVAFGGFIGGAASIANPALAVSAGVRLRATRHWSFGLDGEWNPWLALNGVAARAGVVNIYGTAILRIPLAYENFNLRTSVSLGTSYLISDLYGAPTGSIGLYAGVNFLGLEWKLSRALFLIIAPLNVAVPVPQLKGVPLLYPQYRFTFGFEFYAG